jgi:cytosine/uracil/thiamine/allantoin permease
MQILRRRQALPAIALGTFLISIVMVLNGTIGARLHIPFPVLNRASFGFWLSYFSVISRVILAMFWFGVQTTIGSECVYQVRSVCTYMHGHLMVVISDVKGNLAIHRSSPEPPSSKREYNHLW